MSLLQFSFIQTALRLILRHPICGVVMVPVLEDGRIVLVRRRDNNRWSLPGGMVEWGEDIPTTIHRELQEETGLKVHQIGRVVGIYSAPKRDPRFHSICTTVEVMVRGQFCIEDKGEISEVGAFLPDQIPMTELAHDHRQQLADYWQGTTILA
ncbi:NUDIX hydrolase [Altericista sp. CCNU0014]|uniref:NUDIX hydrolase n=1 Tax=Altericista sp. CCNU0014 TaxID=3082949 RepID=UPI00384D4A74